MPSVRARSSNNRKEAARHAGKSVASTGNSTSWHGGGPETRAECPPLLPFPALLACCELALKTARQPTTIPAPGRRKYGIDSDRNSGCSIAAVATAWQNSLRQSIPGTPPCLHMLTPRKPHGMVSRCDSYPCLRELPARTGSARPNSRHSEACMRS